MRLPIGKEMRLPINKEMGLPRSKSGENGIRPSQFSAFRLGGGGLGVKWCSGEWICDSKGCVCSGGTVITL